MKHRSSSILFGLHTLALGGLIGLTAYTVVKNISLEKQLSLLQTSLTSVTEHHTEQLAVLSHHIDDIATSTQAQLTREQMARTALRGEILSESDIKVARATQAIAALNAAREAEQRSHINEVVRTWKNNVGRMTCYIPNVNGGPATSTKVKGSGTLARTTSGDIIISSNKHVITDADEKKPALNCSFTIGSSTVNIASADIHFSTSSDSGYIPVKNPPAAMVAASKNFSVCTAEPNIGDQIVILGFPGIGSSDSSITATEGIISGTEKDFYITSAKVEQGNSGGAAIVAAQQCYLGLPTFVRAGRVESLARILNNRSSFNR
jgi:S1-C subfamily serine protease